MTKSWILSSMKVDLLGRDRLFWNLSFVRSFNDWELDNVHPFQAFLGSTHTPLRTCYPAGSGSLLGRGIAPPPPPPPSLSLIWAIWKERNRVIFEDVVFSLFRLKTSFVIALISWAGLIANGEHSFVYSLRVIVTVVDIVCCPLSFLFFFFFFFDQ